MFYGSFIFNVKSGNSLLHLVKIQVSLKVQGPPSDEYHLLFNCSQIDVDADDLGYRHGVNPGSVLIHDRYMQMKRQQDIKNKHLPNEDWQPGAPKEDNQVKPSPIAPKRDNVNDEN